MKYYPHLLLPQSQFVNDMMSIRRWNRKEGKLENLRVDIVCPFQIYRSRCTPDLRRLNFTQSLQQLLLRFWFDICNQRRRLVYTRMPREIFICFILPEGIRIYSSFRMTRSNVALSLPWPLYTLFSFSSFPWTFFGLFYDSLRGGEEVDGDEEKEEEEENEGRTIKGRNLCRPSAE